MNDKPFEIIPGIYCVGGFELSHPQDALVYLIKGEEKAALIDSGAGRGSGVIWENIREAGVNPQDLSYLILTHGHVDHIGGASFFQAFESNLSDWQNSMEELLSLKADILCEGHFGIFRTPQKVKSYIEQYMKQYLS